MLATLRRTGAPATFFLTGGFVRLYPVLTRTIGSEPSWAVANHTVDHRHLTLLPDDAAALPLPVRRPRRAHPATGS